MKITINNTFPSHGRLNFRMYNCFITITVGGPWFWIKENLWHISNNLADFR